MAKVLILDRSKSMRNTLRERLEYEGFSTEAAEDEAAALEMCRRIPFDVILSDRGCRVPDTGIPFIVLSAEVSIDSAVEAVRSGARDYLPKPVDMNRLLQSIHRTLDDPSPEPVAAAPVRRARRAHAAHAQEIIGASERIEQVRRLIDKVAPCDARVLITGENGTGKELVARWLHAKSPRAAAPFVEVNCAAIPSELIESELFGHERGAFTSAINTSSPYKNIIFNYNRYRICSFVLWNRETVIKMTTISNFPIEIMGISIHYDTVSTDFYIIPNCDRGI